MNDFRRRGRKATWPAGGDRAPLSEPSPGRRHYRLLLVNGDGHLLAASHALPASVLAGAGAVPLRDAAPRLGSHYQPLSHSPRIKDVEPGAERQRGAGGLDHLVMLAPDGWIARMLLVAYRWPVTIGLGAVLASALRWRWAGRRAPGENANCQPRRRGWRICGVAGGWRRSGSGA